MSVESELSNCPSHLLVVDDDEDSRELVAESLRRLGYQVTEARDGRDALVSIMRECPSLLITDCSMPNMTGNELVATLAGDERWCAIPTIVVSSMEQPALPQNAVFLAKPFTIQKLEAVIRDGLEASSHP